MSVDVSWIALEVPGATILATVEVSFLHVEAPDVTRLRSVEAQQSVGGFSQSAEITTQVVAPPVPPGELRDGGVYVRTRGVRRRRLEDDWSETEDDGALVAAGII